MLRHRCADASSAGRGSSPARPRAAPDGCRWRECSLCGRRLRRRFRIPFRAAIAASRRLGVGDPSHNGKKSELSSPLSLRATSQLQPAQPLWTRVAQNAPGDTRRHATGDTRQATGDRRQATQPAAAVDRINTVHVGQHQLADTADIACMEHKPISPNRGAPTLPHPPTNHRRPVRVTPPNSAARGLASPTLPRRITPPFNIKHRASRNQHPASTNKHSPPMIRHPARFTSLSPAPQTNIMASLPALAAFGGEQVSTG
ncbi:hypothetical protein I41_07170 [Lacipirellula limnantheis]|uniref:Uncharacterized protein n=1 Tax=Lacipirellula limnantheis TaxID=2528024 RepID=A0A517TT55_9BACT|nr:hypothetical protein I41_07170 [Lacipirellula limnantheis]